MSKKIILSLTLLALATHQLDALTIIDANAPEELLENTRDFFNVDAVDPIANKTFRQLREERKYTQLTKGCYQQCYTIVQVAVEQPDGSLKYLFFDPVYLLEHHVAPFNTPKGTTKTLSYIRLTESTRSHCVSLLGEYVDDEVYPAEKCLTKLYYGKLCPTIELPIRKVLFYAIHSIESGASPRCLLESASKQSVDKFEDAIKQDKCARPFLIALAVLWLVLIAPLLAQGHHG